LFQVKICGITRLCDLDAVCEAGADAVGINLVPGSPRCVSITLAQELCRYAHLLGLQSVLVTMNASMQELDHLVTQIRPDVVQLHGQEVPESLPESMSQYPIVKALSWTGRESEAELAQQWLDAGREELSFLVDAYAPGVGGGTGKVARWDLLCPRPTVLRHVPMLLAGGLVPGNVATAIATTACDGVDTASGVETSPGIKDPELIQKFTTAALNAFQTM
jgi:phosphoribosylanthranilate isomerase